MTLKVLKVVRPHWARLFSRKCPCFIDGREMRRLAIPPEKRGDFQKRLLEAALEGNIRSKKEALHYLGVTLHSP